MSHFRHLFTAFAKGYWLTRLDLVCSSSYTAGDKVTSDYTEIIFYVARSDRRDEIGSWNSRQHSIQANEALPMISSEIRLREGDVVQMKRQRHGFAAPPLREFDVQPLIQFKGA